MIPPELSDSHLLYVYQYSILAEAARLLGLDPPHPGQLYVQGGQARSASRGELTYIISYPISTFKAPAHHASLSTAPYNDLSRSSL